MSKLSFRARALDPSKPMPIYLAEELPDLPEYSAINRAVPQMPSGMEKEEESEHHLQRAICTGLIIPTPEVFETEREFYERNYPPTYKMPRQMIHMQPLNLEQDIPDYDMDSADELWVNSQNKRLDLTWLKFEQMMDRLEKSSGQTVVTLNEAKALLKQDDEVSIAVYDYWLNKRLKTQHPLILAVKTENRGGIAANSPYLAFRRRTEKMQTRKNRKNDETSYEKMLKLRRDLSRAVTLLEMIKRREKAKREQMHLSVEVFEKRYQARDYNGQLLAEFTSQAAKSTRPAFAPIYSNQYSMASAGGSPQTHNSGQWQSSANVNHYGATQYGVAGGGSGGANKRDLDGGGVNGNIGSSRKEKRQYKKRKHKQSQRDKRGGGGGLYPSPGPTVESMVSSEEDDLSCNLQASESEDEGLFVFKRNKNCQYNRPLRNGYGNWPWASKEENGGADPKYRFTLTSIGNPRPRCIGFARRRLGRGGRVILDRLSTNVDELWSRLDYKIFDSGLPKVEYDSQTKRLLDVNLELSDSLLNRNLNNNMDNRVSGSSFSNYNHHLNAGSSSYTGGTPLVGEHNNNSSEETAVVVGCCSSSSAASLSTATTATRTLGQERRISVGIVSALVETRRESNVIKSEHNNNSSNNLNNTATTSSLLNDKLSKVLDGGGSNNSGQNHISSSNNGTTIIEEEEVRSCESGRLIGSLPSVKSLDRLSAASSGFFSQLSQSIVVANSSEPITEPYLHSQDTILSSLNRSLSVPANMLLDVVKTEPIVENGESVPGIIPDSISIDNEDDMSIADLVRTKRQANRTRTTEEFIESVRKEWLHFKPQPRTREEIERSRALEESEKDLPKFSESTPLNLELTTVGDDLPSSIFLNSEDNLFHPQPFALDDLMEYNSSPISQVSTPFCSPNLNTKVDSLTVDLNLSGDSLNELSLHLGDNEKMLENILEEYQMDDLKILEDAALFSSLDPQEEPKNIFDKSVGYQSEFVQCTNNPSREKPRRSNDRRVSRQLVQRVTGSSHFELTRLTAREETFSKADPVELAAAIPTRIQTPMDVDVVTIKQEPIDCPADNAIQLQTIKVEKQEEDLVVTQATQAASTVVQQQQQSMAVPTQNIIFHRQADINNYLAARPENTIILTSNINAVKNHINGPIEKAITPPTKSSAAVLQNQFRKITGQKLNDGDLIMTTTGIIQNSNSTNPNNVSALNNHKYASFGTPNALQKPISIIGTTPGGTNKFYINTTNLINQQQASSSGGTILTNSSSTQMMAGPKPGIQELLSNKTLQWSTIGSPNIKFNVMTTGNATGNNPNSHQGTTTADLRNIIAGSMQSNIIINNDKGATSSSVATPTLITGSPAQQQQRSKAAMNVFMNSEKRFLYTNNQGQIVAQINPKMVNIVPVQGNSSNADGLNSKMITTTTLNSKGSSIQRITTIPNSQQQQMLQRQQQQQQANSSAGEIRTINRIVIQSSNVAQQQQHQQQSSGGGRSGVEGSGNLMVTTGGGVVSIDQAASTSSTNSSNNSPSNTVASINLNSINR